MMSFYNNGGFGRFIILILPIIIWVLFWKGYAVWTAVKNNDKKWFVALLVLNTFGLLEIFYVFHIAKKKWSDIKNTVNRILK